MTIKMINAEKIRFVQDLASGYQGYGTNAPLGVYYQQHSVLSKAGIEIATNQINRKWLTSLSNYEHEIIVEELGGLAPDKVETLIAWKSPIAPSSKLRTAPETWQSRTGRTDGWAIKGRHFTVEVIL
jgi:hypothetical protein